MHSAVSLHVHLHVVKLHTKCNVHTLYMYDARELNMLPKKTAVSETTLHGIHNQNAFNMDGHHHRNRLKLIPPYHALLAG